MVFQRVARAIVFAALYAACGGNVEDRSLLGFCVSNAECGPGLACLCGICSRECSNAAGCQSLEGTACSNPESTAFTQVCAGRRNITGLCLRSCVNGTCPGTDICFDPFCTPGVCNTDFSKFARSAKKPVSFRAEVMPVFGLGCVMSSCHDDATRQAGLYLGPRCQYDPVSRCIFPEVLDPSRAFEPLTDEAVRRVAANLMEPSTVAPSVMRVTPGAPDDSFLVDTLLGRQKDRGYTCEDQAPFSALPCGEGMPPWAVLCTDGWSRETVDLIARWIAEGARVD